MTKKEIIKHIAIIVLVPSVLVGAYYGYKFVKKKIDDKKNKNDANKSTSGTDTATPNVDEKNETAQQKEADAMRKKYENINSVDDFIIGAKYIVNPKQYTYDFTQAAKDKDEFNKLGMDKLKSFYELIKLTIDSRTPQQNQDVLDIIHKVQRKQI